MENNMSIILCDLVMELDDTYLGLNFNYIYKVGTWRDDVSFVVQIDDTKSVIEFFSAAASTFKEKTISKFLIEEFKRFSENAKNQNNKMYNDYLVPKE